MTADQKIQAAQSRLVVPLRKIYPEKKSRIEELKKKKVDLKRDDFLWYYLLQSFATMGRSGGSKELKEYYPKIAFEVLAQLTKAQRKRRVQQTCADLKVRFPLRKAEYILECFDRVQSLGGPIAAKDQLLSQNGREGKIKFLKQFTGIGPKYARNIMMDVYHREFRDSIAIDSRISSISRCLGLTFTSAQYSEHENFYLAAAKRANLQGWELDRLLYNSMDEVKQELGCVEDRKRRKD